MSDIDGATDAASGADQRPGSLPQDGPEPALPDEVDLEIIERLAEEEPANDAAPAHVYVQDTHSAARGTGFQPAIDQGPLARAPGDEPLVVDVVKGLAENIGRRLDSLQTLLERELRAEATRERVVDRLHTELQEYKQDFLWKVQRPIFIDLIQLHDDIGKLIDARAPADTGSAHAADIRGILEPIQTAIEDILYRQGVEPFAQEGTEFDPRKQRAVSTQTTDDPALNKRVAARLRKGFCSGDRLVRPEIVVVFTFRPVPAGRND